MKSAAAAAVLGRDASNTRQSTHHCFHHFAASRRRRSLDQSPVGDGTAAPPTPAARAPPAAGARRAIRRRARLGDQVEATRFHSTSEPRNRTDGARTGSRTDQPTPPDQAGNALIQASLLCLLRPVYPRPQPHGRRGSLLLLGLPRRVYDAHPSYSGIVVRFTRRRSSYVLIRVTATGRLSTSFRRSISD